MVPTLEVYSIEQQFSNLRMNKNYLGDDFYLRYMVGYQKKNRIGGDVRIQLPVLCTKKHFYPVPF